MSAKISRRQLFKPKPIDFIQLVRESKKDNSHEETTVAYCRPPGAIPDEAKFLKTCERCHKCADACPHDVIQTLGPKAGRAENTPILNLEHNPCRWCEHMDCIRACPSGALAFGENETVAPIGKAKINLETCLNTEGILCDRCKITCPASVKAISFQNRMPQLDENKCVGCGLCAYYCESTPISIQLSTK